MILDCESLAIDNAWSLTRTNACHIANQNQEMGELRDYQKDFGFRLSTIEAYVSVNTWIWGVIATTIIATTIKKIFERKVISKINN